MIAVIARKGNGKRRRLHSSILVTYPLREKGAWRLVTYYLVHCLMGDTVVKVLFDLVMVNLGLATEEI